MSIAASIADLSPIQFVIALALGALLATAVFAHASGMDRATRLPGASRRSSSPGSSCRSTSSATGFRNARGARARAPAPRRTHRSRRPVIGVERQPMPRGVMRMPFASSSDDAGRVGPLGRQARSGRASRRPPPSRSVCVLTPASSSPQGLELVVALRRQLVERRQPRGHRQRVRVERAPWPMRSSRRGSNSAITSARPPSAPTGQPAADDLAQRRQVGVTP